MFVNLDSSLQNGHLEITKSNDLVVPKSEFEFEGGTIETAEIATSS